MKLDTQEQLRCRLKKYIELNPVKYTELGKMIGIDKYQRYKLTRFLNATYTLADINRDMLESFLSARGY